MRSFASLFVLLALAPLFSGCGDESGGSGVGAGGTGGSFGGAGGVGGAAETFVVVTFNTGTTDGLDHDAPPEDDGYSSADAVISDEWYGNGLSWPNAIDATRNFLHEVAPDIVAFQEIFFTEKCVDIPIEARTGFACARLPHSPGRADFRGARGGRTGRQWRTEPDPG